MGRRLGVIRPMVRAWMRRTFEDLADTQPISSWGRIRPLHLRHARKVFRASVASCIPAGDRGSYPLWGEQYLVAHCAG